MTLDTCSRVNLHMAVADGTEVFQVVLGWMSPRSNRTSTDDISL
jgi:hypothetical protein